jgi:hypothetical protein
MVNVFQLQQEYARWAERTVYSYFKGRHRKLGFDIFYFGSQVGTRKKDKGDAPLRPDFIFIKNKNIKVLEKKYRIKFNNVSINRLKKIVELTPDDCSYLKQFPEYWLTKMLDKELLLRDIVKNAHCMLEIKSGFWIFDQEKYDTDKLNIILPLNFDKRMKKIKIKFKTRFSVYAAYILLDKAYIVKVKNFKNWKKHSFGGRQIKDKVLPFRKSHFFGNILGAVKYKNGKPKIIGKPIIEVEKGAVRLSLKMPISKMNKVNVRVIKNLLD